MPAKSTKKIKPGKYDARELWQRSPTPAEDWDVDFALEIIGEEVGYGGEIKYEVDWKNWRRADGTSTTWEGPDTTSEHLPTFAWEEKRLAEMPNRPDIVLWGTTDIANTRTRERKQGYKESTSEECAKFDKEFDEMVKRMERLAERSKHQFPDLYRRYKQEQERTAGRPEIPPAAAPQTQPAVVRTMPLPRQYLQMNAKAGSSRPHVNAEAGPSRSRRVASPTTSAPRSHAASSSRLSTVAPSRPLTATETASSSRPTPIPTTVTALHPAAGQPAVASFPLPTTTPWTGNPSYPPLPRRTSPAISVSSSADSVEFLHMSGPPNKRKTTPPVNPRPHKRCELPLRDPVGGSTSMHSISRNPLPNASTTSTASSSRPSISQPPATSSSRPPTASVSDSTTPASSLALPLHPFPTSASGSRPTTRTSFPVPPPPLPTSRASTSSTSTRSPREPSPSSASTFTLPSTSPHVHTRAAARSISTSDSPELRKRKAEDVLERRECECGSILPPPDVHRGHMCPTCRESYTYRQRMEARSRNLPARDCAACGMPLPANTPSEAVCDGCREQPHNTFKRRMTALSNNRSARICVCGPPLSPPDGDVCERCAPGERKGKQRQSDKEASRSVSTTMMTMRSSSTLSTRASAVALEKMTTVPTSLLPQPLPLPGSMRKGKARESVKSLRLQIETTWSSIASKEGAAGVTFRNDVDDEELPPTVQGDNFEYLEDAYSLSPSLGLGPQIATPAAFFTFCDCKGDNECDELNRCGCQDANDALGTAYTDHLFNFTYGPDQVVVECNPYCHCSTDCPNRVAQRPRDFPIEVFKTERCGWGVRSSVPMEKGKVLGLYTGMLITRGEAIELSGEAKDYCFDLDYNQEHEDDEQDLSMKYTVDSLKYGNWTRFINHSCEPNLRVQPVVYDTLPSQNMAFLAFIAMEMIPAWTEFTFDYDPAAQRDHEGAQAQVHTRKRSKRLSERPNSATDCVCGARRCRGWVRT